MKASFIKVLIGLTLLSLLTYSALAAGVDKTKKYSEWEKAAYLTDEQLDFIRPGLQLSIDSITIGADLKPVVVFTIKDGNGQPLDRDGILSPGVVATSWVLSRINTGDTQYTAYTTRSQTSAITKVTAIQPSSDSGGLYKKLADGQYQYTFGTALPATYPKNVTTTLGVYSTRDLRPYGLIRHVVNIIKSWVPDGTPVKTIRDVSASAACNQCHDPLQAHGGSRQELQLCILCHVPNAIDPDTGNSIDMKVMVHKIHRGSSLPSVVAGGKYQIIGNANAVVDFSGVAFPQDIRNCTTCHQKATQANNWYLTANRETCGTCHDDIVWSSGKNHLGGAAISDKFCTTCHFPQGELEYDASIKGAHTNPFDSTQLVKPVFQIVNVTGALPGGKAKVDFKITDKNGKAIAYKDFTRLALTIAGPTTDYSFQLSEQPTAAAVTTVNDVNTYTFAGALPANAAGTFSFGMEGYVNTSLNKGTTKEVVFRDRGDSLFKDFAVTGTTVSPRRVVVDNAKCLVCHDTWAVHGNNRTNTQYCVTCHNPSATDSPVRPATDKPDETIDFRTMVHKIHSGTNLSRPYLIYGFGGSKNDFSDVEFPGERLDCLQCHATGTYVLPLKDNLASVQTKRDFFSPTPPETAACLGCHDTKATAAHAYVNIAAFGESCAVCHGAGADFDVVKVHAH